MKENKSHFGLKRLVMPILFLLMCVPFALAQDPVKVTGKVLDNLGEPMIGVSVQVKGTSHGAITDIDGNYSVSVEPGATLVFSYVGYISQEHKAMPGTLNVTLKEDTETLDEVVVIGYGVQKKSSVTGAISQVKAEDMENRTITTAAQALQGKTAGVQLITTSGGPGEAPTIRVRGYSSNVASNPLYVVDGVRLSDISGIDPNDIESMEVLKDAASAAIYGAEAGNGVILITTKKGRPGQTKISYDFQFASQSIARIPELMNAQEYVDYMTSLYPDANGNLTESIIPMATIEANWNGVTDTDWVDAIFENSKMQKHNLSFAGGSDRGSYYLSLTYLDNNGIIVGDNDHYSRMTASINADYKIKPWLKVGTTNQIEKYNVRRVTGQNAYGSTLSAVLMMDPLTAPIYSPDNLPGGRELQPAHHDEEQHHQEQRFQRHRLHVCRPHAVRRLHVHFALRLPPERHSPVQHQPALLRQLGAEQSLCQQLVRAVLHHHLLPVGELRQLHEDLCRCPHRIGHDWYVFPGTDV